MECGADARRLPEGCIAESSQDPRKSRLTTRFPGFRKKAEPVRRAQKVLRLPKKTASKAPDCGQTIAIRPDLSTGRFQYEVEVVLMTAATGQESVQAPSPLLECQVRCRHCLADVVVDPEELNCDPMPRSELLPSQDLGEARCAPGVG